MIRLAASAPRALVALVLLSAPALAAGRPAPRPMVPPPAPCGVAAPRRAAFAPAAPDGPIGGCPALLSTRTLVRPPGLHAL